MNNLLKVLVLVGLAYWGYTQWSDSGSAGGTAYTEISMPTDLKPNHVMVVAAENCPKAAAQQADAITRSLRDKQIPVQRVHTVNFHIASQADAQAIEKVMNAGPPVVFYNGKAQAKPSWDDVLAMVNPETTPE